MSDSSDPSYSDTDTLKASVLRDLQVAASDIPELRRLDLLCEAISTQREIVRRMAPKF